LITFHSSSIFKTSASYRQDQDFPEVQAVLIIVLF